MVRGCGRPTSHRRESNVGDCSAHRAGLCVLVAPYKGAWRAYEQEIGDWTVTIESNFIDMDQAPFFKGAPNDQCQANHFGYVLKGKFGVRTGEGVEEFFEAGDAVIMPNIIKFAKEQGIELPAQGMSS